MISMNRIGALCAVALATSGCMPKTGLQVLQPAAVDVPADIRVIGVVDRSGPANAGEHVLGALEGLITGEAVGADVQGREAAIEAVVRELEASPRFDVVRPTLPEAAQGGLFDRELEQRLVERVCRQAGCDALLVLEAFDSDRAITVDGVTVASLADTDRLKRQIADLDVDDVTASARTTVMASFRMYDADAGRVVDAYRDRTQTFDWSGSGSLVDVRRAMPTAGLATSRAGARIGADYAARVAPTWQWVDRRYYGAGDPRLREARRYVKAGDWEGAARIWRSLLDDPRPRVRGRAAYNLALAHEVQGDLEGALARAREAAVALSNRKARGYVFTLEQRLRDAERLSGQMAPLEERPVRERPGRPAPAREKVRPERGGRTLTGAGRSEGRPGGMTRPG